MLRRNEFSILKEFKGEGIETTARGIDFEDWKPFIIYRCVVGSQAFGLSGDDSDGDRRGIYLFATISGAHLYGFPSPDSDYDLCGAHVLPLDAVVGLEVRDKTVQDSRVIDGLEMDMGDRIEISREVITSGAGAPPPVAQGRTVKSSG